MENQKTSKQFRRSHRKREAFLYDKTRIKSFSSPAAVVHAKLAVDNWRKKVSRFSSPKHGMAHGTNPRNFKHSSSFESSFDSQDGSTGSGDFQDSEKTFLLAIEHGDLATVRNILELNLRGERKININCTDPLGRSGILIAIENENNEILELLLSYGAEIGDSLLHAISEENVEAVEIILQYQSQKKKNLQGLLGSNFSTRFTPDITPLILAAHRDNFEIVKLLLDRGEKIPVPHDVRCNCRDCLANSRDDSLRHSRSRINAFRALASPTLICLSSHDPILTSFELSLEMKRLSRLENEFKQEYEELADNCKNFATLLLDQTRGLVLSLLRPKINNGSKELELLLNRDVNEADLLDLPPGRTINLTRLKLAVKYKQKKFVAHPNVQQLLGSLWYEGLPGFKRSALPLRLSVILFIGLSFPFLSIVYILFPRSRIGRYIRKPFVKFIFLLFMTTQLSIQTIFNSGQTAVRDAMLKKERTVQSHSRPPNFFEWIILSYVIAFIWNDIKKIWRDGGKAYLQNMWHVLDYMTNALYVVTITLRIIAWYKMEYFVRTGHPYHLLSRKDWDPYDPFLMAECFFASANIFSQLKLIYIFIVNPHLGPSFLSTNLVGPLQISLGRMIQDILKFTCVFVMVLFAFASGMNQLYWYYVREWNEECVAKQESGESYDDVTDCFKEHRYVSNLFEIIQTLYWALFGLVSLENTDLRDYKHVFTEFAGKLMFGAYSGIANIVLINMLIAMMSNSYQAISVLSKIGHSRPIFVQYMYMLCDISDEDIEWKFARSKLWISFFQDGFTIPPPFNIIPSPKSLWYILLWIRRQCCKFSQEYKANTWRNLQQAVRAVHDREAEYKAMMKDLTKRYIMSRQRTEQDGVTEDDLTELKQDISAFRFELLEILRNNGMILQRSSGAFRRGTRRMRSFGRIRSVLSTNGQAAVYNGSEDPVDAGTHLSEETQLNR